MFFRREARREPAIFLRRLVVSVCLCLPGFFHVAAAEIAPERDAKVERELAELYGKTVDSGKSVSPERQQADMRSAVEGSKVPVERQAVQAKGSAKKGALFAGATPVGEAGGGKEKTDKKEASYDAKTLTALRQAAKKGDAAARFGLGQAYERGEGVRQNLKEAALWYARASQGGHAGARLNLGKMFYAGRGVKQDRALAFTHFRQAAEQGLPEAQFLVGKMYWEGMGVTASRTIALAWYRQAAEGGYAAAQYGMGRLFVEGEAVEQDIGEAVRWYERAAAQGLPAAQAAMGLAYEMGYGVTTDRQEALRWYGLAAAQGHPGASARIQAMHGP